MIRTSRRGASDVFEEIPSILVVIVATFFFLMTMADTIISHSEFHNERSLMADLSSFCDSVLSYGPLLHDSTYGRLDSGKLTEKARSGFQNHHDPQLLGFHYNITITDVSLYETIYHWTVGEARSRSSLRAQALVPAVICNELGERHSAILRIIIWR